MKFPDLTFEQTIEMLRANGAPVKITDAMARRECGDCDFCCTAKGIGDLEPEPKSPWSPCPQLRECGGCAIYEAKPASCSDYFCAWRLGLGGEGSRPDKAGVMVDVEALDERPGELGLIVHASGPYKVIPVIRMIDDARLMGIGYVGFAEVEEDLQVTLIEYAHDPAMLRARLSRHAGLGLTGWNKPSGDGGNNDEEDQ